MSRKYQSKKCLRIFDLDQKRSLGNITQSEFKRLVKLNLLNNISFEPEKVSLHDPGSHNEIISMEVAPYPHKLLLTLTKNSSFAIFNINSHPLGYKIKLNKHIRADNILSFTPPNSIHWFWDCSMISIGIRYSIQFWDVEVGEEIETIRLRSSILNHVIAAKEHTVHDYVAVSGNEGNVFILDIRVGNIVLTSHAVERNPIRALHWHPNNDLQYATGNDNGNIFLWDTRFQKKALLKFCGNESFNQVSSHEQPVAGLRFYNNGTSIVSIDNEGTVKSWEVSSGRIRLGYYDQVQFCNFNQHTFYKEYQFSTTDNLKDDIAFMPSAEGLCTFDLNTGKQLSYSKALRRSIICTSYDPQTLRVYGSMNNIIRSWAPLQPTPDDLT
ncbi:DNA excision repair protein ERCC-8-like [Adelges cooleyi]|uniref:DNA excision repair protein ERCC-8-like n=1 Tax=Adelges cooleyi TaxID=133065 RepID=UPI00217F501A|nr:DNA excision repair protein ERCC-8-like [Adelges cooleyi]